MAEEEKDAEVDLELGLLYCSNFFVASFIFSLTVPAGRSWSSEALRPVVVQVAKRGVKDTTTSLPGSDDAGEDEEESPKNSFTPFVNASSQTCPVLTIPKLEASPLPANTASECKTLASKIPVTDCRRPDAEEEEKVDRIFGTRGCCE